MKTLPVILRLAGYAIGTLFAFAVVPIPTVLYVAAWYLSPMTFWPVLWLTTIGGTVWIVLQIIAVMCAIRLLLWQCSR